MLNAVSQSCGEESPKVQTPPRALVGSINIDSPKILKETVRVEKYSPATSPVITVPSCSNECLISHESRCESESDQNMEVVDSATFQDDDESIENNNAENHIINSSEYFDKVESYLDFEDIADGGKLELPSLVNEPLQEIRKLDFENMRVIGQFNLGFIITELSSTDSSTSHLLIVDQHAADEKFNYELYQRETKLSTQPLIV